MVFDSYLESFVVIYDHFKAIWVEKVKNVEKIVIFKNSVTRWRQIKFLIIPGSYLGLVQLDSKGF